MRISNLRGYLVEVKMSFPLDLGARFVWWENIFLLFFGKKTSPAGLFKNASISVAARKLL